MPRAWRDSAFLNIPYDTLCQERFVAFLAGLASFGLYTRVTLELTGGERRLDRIYELIAGCRYSFHDLSRVQLDRRPPATPRFNMPFELGLVVGWQKAAKLNHTWFVFESTPHRLQKSLSDLNGTDAFVYGGTVDGVLREIRNALSRRDVRSTASEMRLIYDYLNSAAAGIKARAGACSLFEARVFAELLVAARRSAERVIRGLGD